ncbi:MAG: D-hexose-6-phosphate mutarotase [Mariprofundaceae bacterium]|nr:D-hexose-6-phosphate mutarotase [Mariprofundaceae bacterium]
METVQKLNETWGIEGALSVVNGQGDMPIVDVCNTLGKASIALQGAHILSFQPNGQEPVIWMSNDATFAAGKSWRGGVPICWPWFGPHASDASLPGHGPARTVNWKITNTEALADGRTRVDFEMLQNDQTKAICGHDLLAQLHVIVGATLEIKLETKNLGKTSFTLGQALHTYFHVGDVRNVSVEGLEGCEYLDKMEDFSRKTQYGAVKITQETDRVYVGTGSRMCLIDPDLERTIVIQKQGSSSAIIWNPWIETANKMGDLGVDGYLNMLCVETANAVDDVIELAAGASYVMATEYKVE